MKSVWKWLKRLGTAVVALASFLFLVNTILIWITSARLELKVKALRDAGEPLSVKELAPKAIPDDQNAATYLRKARADVDAAWKELDSIYEHMIDSDDHRTEADSKAIQKILETYASLIPIFEQAAACSNYQAGVDYSAAPMSVMDQLSEKLQDIRLPMHLLKERVRLQIAQGKRDEALGTTVLMFRILRHAEREPMLITYFGACHGKGIAVDAANRVLRSGTVSAKARAELDAELWRADNHAAFERSLKRERAFEFEQLSDFTSKMRWMFRGYFNDTQCYSLDMAALKLAQVSKPYSEAQAAFQKFRKDTESSWRYLFAGPSGRWLERSHETHTRSIALLRCGRVFSALQQKSLTGDAASIKLGELGLPAEATIDPYSGLPLLVRKSGKEWIVYCVGTNLIDDGGVLENHKDVGVGPIDRKK